MNALLFLTATDYIPPPYIESDSNFFATNGSSFKLTCWVEVEPSLTYEIIFILPNGEVAETNDHMEVTTLQHDDERVYINLVICKSVEDRDRGDYNCTVIDNYNNTNSKIATMIFVEKPLIAFKVATPIIQHVKEENRGQAQFKIEYTAYPSATFYWFNNFGEQISTNQTVTNFNKNEVVVQKKSIELMIKGIELNDYGNYTLIGTAAGMNFSTQVTLIVNGKHFCACCCHHHS